MKVTRTPSMMQKISWRCDDYHANTIILNQAMGYVLSEKIECVATLVGGYCTLVTPASTYHYLYGFPHKTQYAFKS